MEGLQVWDESGKEIFNSNTRTFKVLAQFDYSPNTTRTVTHPLILEQNVTYFVTPPFMGGYNFISALKNGSSYTLTINEAPDMHNFQSDVDFKITVGVY